MAHRAHRDGAAGVLGQVDAASRRQHGAAEEARVEEEAVVVGVAEEADHVFAARQRPQGRRDVLGRLQVGPVLDVVERGVGQDGAGDLGAHRKTGQPVQGVVVEGPHGVEHAGPHRIGPGAGRAGQGLGLVSERRDEVVVVPAHADAAHLPDPGHHLGGERAVSDEIAAEGDAVHAFLLDFAQYCVQGVDVRVEVGEDRDAGHGAKGYRPPGYRPAKDRRSRCISPTVVRPSLRAEGPEISTSGRRIP